MKPLRSKKPLRDTQALSTYLYERHGIRRSPAYLRKLRCIGGGPRFRYLNGKPYYEDDEADEWVELSLSPPMSSTSEADAEKPSAGIGDPGINDFFDDVPAPKRGSPHLAASPGRASPPQGSLPLETKGNLSDS